VAFGASVELPPAEEPASLMPSEAATVLVSTTGTVSTVTPRSADALVLSLSALVTAVWAALAAAASAVTIVASILTEAEVTARVTAEGSTEAVAASLFLMVVDAVEPGA